MGAGLSFSTALFAVNNFQAVGVDLSIIREFGLRLLPFLFATGGFTILYLALPNRRVGIRYALLGAGVAAVMFELLKSLFGLYLANAGTFESVYGSLATLPVFLIPDIPLNLETLQIILPYSAAVAAVGLLESLMTAQIVDDLTDTKSDKNQECIGQGVANFCTGFIGGMAAE